MLKAFFEIAEYNSSSTLKAFRFHQQKNKLILFENKNQKQAQ